MSALTRLRTPRLSFFAFYQQGENLETLTASCLKGLTKENWNKPKARFLRFLKRNAVWGLLLLGLGTYTGYQEWSFGKELQKERFLVYRLMHESALKGCPVFSPPSTIIVSGDNPKAMRRALDIAVQDLENFNVELSKLTEGAKDNAKFPIR